jgi:hypothetical protein
MVFIGGALGELGEPATLWKKRKKRRGKRPSVCATLLLAKSKIKLHPKSSGVLMRDCEIPLLAP